jgi:hypothetical protein
MINLKPPSPLQHEMLTDVRDGSNPALTAVQRHVR